MGLAVEPPGSLFDVEHAIHNDTVAVTNILTDKGLQGLGFFPWVGEVRRNAQALLQVLHVLTRWQEARLSGVLVEFRHRQVIDCILDAVYGSLCGQHWAEAETGFRKNPKSPETLEILKSWVDKKTPDFAAALVRNRLEIESEPDQCVTWFTEVAMHNKICDDRELCDFALRLASQSQTSSSLPHTDLDTLVSRILNNPAILRGARLLVLLASSNNHISDKASLLPRWQR